MTKFLKKLTAIQTFLAVKLILFLLVLNFILHPPLSFCSAPEFSSQRSSEKTVVAKKELFAFQEKISAWLRQLPAVDQKEASRIFGQMLEATAAGYPVVEELSRRLLPPGEGDDSLARYALDGLIQQAGSSAPKKLQEKLVSDMLKAVERTSNSDLKAFLLNEIGFIFNQDRIKALSPYLLDARLADEATRVLLKIKNPEVEKLLLQSFDRAPLEARLSLIQALAAIRSKKAVGKIKPLAFSSEDRVQQLALAALAEIADPSTEALFSTMPTLASRQQKTQFASLYLHFARRLAEDGNRERALAIARKAISSLDSAEEVAVRSDALNLVVEILKEKAFPEILEALKSDNKEYRLHALRLAKYFDQPELTPRWLEALSRIEGPAVAEFIDFLGERKDKAALPAVLSFLSNPEENVTLSAIRASFNLGGKEIVSTIVPLVGKSRAETRLILQMLGTLRPEEYLDEILKLYPGMKEDCRLEVLTIIQNKISPKWKEAILNDLNSPDSELAKAASECLPAVVGEGDLPWLLEKLPELEEPARIQAFQKAIVSALSQITDLEKRQQLILTAIDSCMSRNRTKATNLIRILPHVGGEKSLEKVLGLINDRDPEIKAAAIYALTSWPDFEASKPLLALLQNNPDRKTRFLACQGIVRLVKDPRVSKEEKLKILEEMKPLVAYPDEKNLLLEGWANLKDVKSLEEIAEFFGDDSLKEKAAVLACRLARPVAGKEGLKGWKTIWILKKALLLLNDDLEIQETEAYLHQLLLQEGFVCLFNGKDLEGWKGLVGDPVQRSKMSAEELAAAQKKADEDMRRHWRVIDGILVFDGKGNNLCTVKDYCDFELFVDWKIEPGGDSGIYLRGSPQVQIWDPAQWPEGSGGLYNNQKNPNKPLKCADQPVGRWNTFYIKMIGDKVTVYLNGELVVDEVVMENYWERDKPIYRCGQIELQAHHTPLYFKNIYLREINKNPGPENSEQEK